MLILSTIPMLLCAQARPDGQAAADRAAKRLDAETTAVLRDKRKNEKLNKYAQFLEPQDEKELSDDADEAAAGRISDQGCGADLLLCAVRAGHLGLLGAGVAYFIVFVDGPPHATTQQTLMYILGPGAAGYMFPKYWITKRVQKRKEEIESRLSRLAGHDAGLRRGGPVDGSSRSCASAKELRASYPVAGRRIRNRRHEMKAGKDKTHGADRHVGTLRRAGCVVLCDRAEPGHSFGTSISDALRVYASEMRDKRVMRAEEKANQLPTKMTLRTMMLTVPPLLIILVGPSAVGITEMGNIGK